MQWPGDKIGTVEFAGDAHGECEFAGAGGEVFDLVSARSPAAHHWNARDRFEGADQHASGLALGLAHEIQTLIHSIDEIDVSIPRRSKDEACSSGRAAPGMGCAIAHAEVRFHLDDASGG